MKRKIIFANHNFYHVYNRGVEKRDIFLDKKDYLRFIHDLYEFNDTSPAGRFGTFGAPGSEVSEVLKPKERERFVNIICFCLMPNHFHLVLEQLRDGGVSLFMQKLAGYVYFFNLKYNRVGPLFQGPYKIIQVEKENYLLHLSRYIHLNPVEIIEPDWRENGIKNWTNVHDFLQTYRWSGYLDYIGIKNFPSIINRELISSYFKTPDDYKEFISHWLFKDLEQIKDFISEK